MVRELVENAIGIVRESEQANVEEAAKQRVQERVLDMLVPPPTQFDASSESDDPQERHRRTREKFRGMLLAGELDERKVTITVEQKATPVMVGGMGMENMDIALQGMLDKLMPKPTSRREMTVLEAGKFLLEQEI
jgi:ATP-dependent HslUV protease ATP-binding subunit HslU